MPIEVRNDVSGGLVGQAAYIAGLGQHDRWRTELALDVERLRQQERQHVRTLAAQRLAQLEDNALRRQQFAVDTQMRLGAMGMQARQHAEDRAYRDWADQRDFAQQQAMQQSGAFYDQQQAGMRFAQQQELQRSGAEYDRQGMEQRAELEQKAISLADQRRLEMIQSSMEKVRDNPQLDEKAKQRLYAIGELHKAKIYNFSPSMLMSPESPADEPPSFQEFSRMRADAIQELQAERNDTSYRPTTQEIEQRIAEVQSQYRRRVNGEPLPPYQSGAGQPAPPQEQPPSAVPQGAPQGIARPPLAQPQEPGLRYDVPVPRDGGVDDQTPELQELLRRSIIQRKTAEYASELQGAPIVAYARTVEEAAQLPPGTIYVHPDGTVRRRAWSGSDHNIREPRPDAWNQPLGGPNAPTQWRGTWPGRTQ